MKSNYIFVTVFCVIILNEYVMGENCKEDDLIQRIAEWSNTLPVLVKQDKKRLENFRNFEPIDDNPSLLRNTYYRMVSETQQTAWFVNEYFFYYLLTFEFNSLKNLQQHHQKNWRTVDQRMVRRFFLETRPK